MYRSNWNGTVIKFLIKQKTINSNINTIYSCWIYNSLRKSSKNFTIQSQSYGTLTIQVKKVITRMEEMIIIQSARKTHKYFTIHVKKMTIIQTASKVSVLKLHWLLQSCLVQIHRVPSSLFQKQVEKISPPV